MTEYVRQFRGKSPLDFKVVNNLFEVTLNQPPMRKPDRGNCKQNLKRVNLREFLPKTEFQLVTLEEVQVKIFDAVLTKTFVSLFKLDLYKLIKYLIM